MNTVVFEEQPEFSIHYMHINAFLEITLLLLKWKHNVNDTAEVKQT